MSKNKIKSILEQIKELELKGDELKYYLLNNFQKLGIPNRDSARWFYHNVLQSTE